jgi:hypothetical protein
LPRASPDSIPPSSLLAIIFQPTVDCWMRCLLHLFKTSFFLQELLQATHSLQIPNNFQKPHSCFLICSSLYLCTQSCVHMCTCTFVLLSLQACK